MNNFCYTYIDGDDIGLRIELSFMENDETALIEINRKVKQAVEVITQCLINLEQEIIFSGADGIICKGVEMKIEGLLNQIRSLSKEIRFSIGTGYSLRDAYLALRYAKSSGKNIAVKLEHDSFSIMGG